MHTQTRDAKSAPSFIQIPNVGVEKKNWWEGIIVVQKEGQN